MQPGSGHGKLRVATLGLGVGLYPLAAGPGGLPKGETSPREIERDVGGGENVGLQ